MEAWASRLGRTVRVGWSPCEQRGDGVVRRDEVTPETWAIVSGRPEPVPGAPLNSGVVAASTYVLGGPRIYSRNESTEGWDSL